jgi:hypothetical protein
MARVFRGKSIPALELHYVKLTAMSDYPDAYRTFDAERINALVNDPTIRPFVGGDGQSFIDLTSAVEDHKNYFLGGDHGAFAFTWSSPRSYEVHTFILPSGRGTWSRGFARAARDYMQSIGTRQLWTRVPVGAENIAAFTEDAGFSRCGSQTIDIGAGPVAYDLYEWSPSCLLH